MKTRTILFISALLALTSCGSAARFASDASRQKYQDGIYYTSSAKVHQAEEAATSANDEETDLLVAKTKNSPIFMKSGEKVDTLFIPENKAARIDFNNTDNTTSVYLYDNGFDTWAAYQPWYATSWYSWNRPFYTSIYWGANPWYYGGWYSPWHYDPWYMDIPGGGAIRGITADGTTLGTGILGTIADGTVAGMEAGTAAGTIRGITEAGATAIITTTTVTSSVLAADGFTLHVLAQPAQAEEAESGPLQGAPE